MENNIIAEEISKELNISIERAIEAIEDSEIDIYDTAEDAYTSIMGIHDMNTEELTELLLQVINEKCDNESPLDSWIGACDGMIKLSSKIAHVSENLYNNK